MTSPAAASSASSLRDKSASTNHAVKRVAAATKADGSQAALWKSLEYWWLANPGGDVSAFLAANKRWDSWYLNEHSSKLAAAEAIIKHDTLLSDRPASADKQVLARTQYLVAKFLFLSNRKDATISDWDATAQTYARDVPHKVRAFKWKTENERDNRFSSSILHAVAPSDDKFRAQEHQMERSRHTYLQSMKEFFLERGAVDGGSEGDRAEEQWAEVQRLWEALQTQHYEQQEHQWKAGQEKKLVWEEDRLKSLERQDKQHREVETDVMRANAYHAKHIKYQVWCCAVLCGAVRCCAVLCGAVWCCVVLCGAAWCSTLQYVAVCCSMLQHVAVCCSMLQCVAACCRVLQCVALCCSVLLCVAVWCSVLQRVAVCCSRLQCDAVCCGVLQ